MPEERIKSGLAGLIQQAGGYEELITRLGAGTLDPFLLQELDASLGPARLLELMAQAQVIRRMDLVLDRLEALMLRSERDEPKPGRA